MIIDGVEYSEIELDVLREYAGRKKSSSNKNSLADYLGIAQNGNESINQYLATGKIPYTIQTVTQFKDFLYKIEILYGIACKYGASHDYKWDYLYREEKYYNDIVGDYDYRVDKPRKREWIANTFKSFSRNRGESDVFKIDEFGSHKLVIDGCTDQTSRKIPFIDVNKLLSDMDLFSDEKEILFPPYQQYIVSEDSSCIPKPGTTRNISVPENDYHLTITPNTRDPRNVVKQKSDGKEINEFHSKDCDVTDAEIKLYLEYYQKDKITSVEREVFEKLRYKLQNYTMTRCKKIHKIYMEKPLLIGNNVTDIGIDQYPGVMNDEPDSEIIITLDEVKEKIRNDVSNMIGWGIPSLFDEYYTRLPKYEQQKKYNIIKKNDINLELVYSVLDSNHRKGNYDFVRKLAEKGLLIDEVLAYDGYITPKGLENMDYVFCSCFKDKGKSEPITFIEAKNKYLNDSLSSLYHITLSDLIEKGLKVLPEDDDKRKGYDAVSKGKRRGGLDDSFDKFDQYLSIDYKERDDSIICQELEL